MDSIEQDLRTYGGITKAARARAQGLTTLGKDEALAKKLAERGLDATDAQHLDAAAAAIEADVELARQLWAKLQTVAAHLHEEAHALADDVRSTDDAARAALGRKSKDLPTLGIKPVGRPIRRAAVEPKQG